MNLDSINLNLLKALDALLTEKNVSNAAKVIFLSQPATSHALNKLRELFKDEILIRTPEGMQPTAFAQSIQSEVRSLLTQIDALVNRVSEFDPLTSEKTFSIGTIDYADYVLIPSLMRWIAKNDSNIKVRTNVLPQDEVITRLERGEVDIALTRMRDIPAHFSSESLCSSKFACVTCQTHPIVAEGMSLNSYLKYPHIVISSWESRRSDIDAILSKKGHSRNVGLTVPHSVAIPSAIPQTKLIATTTVPMAKFFSEKWNLAMLPCPLSELSMDTRQVWHKRYDNDMPHMWLRNMFKETSGELNDIIKSALKR